MLKEEKKEKGRDVEDEMLYHYSMEILKRGMEIDYFIFGHRHLPIDHALSESSRLVILGDWLMNFTYASFDGLKLELKYFKQS